MPSRPRAPSSLASSRGSSPRSNQPAISGSTLSVTKLRTVSLISRSSSLSSRSMARKSSGLGVAVMVLPPSRRRGASGSPASQRYRYLGSPTWDHGDSHELDRCRGVEQAAHLEQRGGDVVPAEVPAPALAEPLELCAVGGGVGQDDLHPHQVLRPPAGARQRGDQVGKGTVELLGHGGRGDAA